MPRGSDVTALTTDDHQEFKTVAARDCFRLRGVISTGSSIAPAMGEEQLPHARQAASRRPIEDERLGGDIWFELVA
jgi:hypothetical protein